MYEIHFEMQRKILYWVEFELDQIDQYQVFGYLSTLDFLLQSLKQHYKDMDKGDSIDHQSPLLVED